MTDVRQAFVGLGANLGDRLAALRAAVERLRQARGITWIGCSHCYETEPVGVTTQPRFLNQVAAVETTLSPEDLLALLQAVEHEFGRVRTVRWGPRTLDLDLLAFEGETRATDRLTLPHPRMLERGFVTVPLRELINDGRFDRAAWAELRATLAALPANPEGVVRCEE